MHEGSTINNTTIISIRTTIKPTAVGRVQLGSWTQRIIQDIMSMKKLLREKSNPLQIGTAPVINVSVGRLR
jgi:hypothetical protein